MNGSQTKSPVRSDDAAVYIEQASAELRDMAQRTGFPFIAYLLEMARMEAAVAAGQRPVRVERA